MAKFKVQVGGNLVGASNDLGKVKGQNEVTFVYLIFNVNCEYNESCRSAR